MRKYFFHFKIDIFFTICQKYSCKVVRSEQKWRPRSSISSFDRIKCVYAALLEINNFQPYSTRPTSLSLDYRYSHGKYPNEWHFLISYCTVLTTTSHTALDTGWNPSHSLCNSLGRRMFHLAAFQVRLLYEMICKKDAFLVPIIFSLIICSYIFRTYKNCLTNPLICVVLGPCIGWKFSEKEKKRTIILFWRIWASIIFVKKNF